VEVAKTLKKNAGPRQDATGFVVNRLLLRLMAEIFATVDEGTPVAVADAALRPLGLPIAAVRAASAGRSGGYAARCREPARSVRGSLPLSANLRALVASGRPGIYDWTADGEPYVSDETAALFEIGDQPSTAEQVRDRALAALASEIGLMLAEEVVAAPMDIDLCMILGAGWPFPSGRRYALPGPGGHLRARARPSFSCHPESPRCPLAPTCQNPVEPRLNWVLTSRRGSVARSSRPHAQSLRTAYRAMS
jgi:hypothetical protein